MANGGTNIKITWVRRVRWIMDEVKEATEEERRNTIWKKGHGERGKSMGEKGVDNKNEKKIKGKRGSHKTAAR